MSAAPFMVVTWRTRDGDLVAMNVTELTVAAVFVAAIVDNGWKLHEAQTPEEFVRGGGCT